MSNRLQRALQLLSCSTVMTALPPGLSAVASPATAPTAQQAEAVQAQKTFDFIFGAEARRATASPDPKDRVDFARKLLDTTGTVHDDPGLEALIYEKAYEFAAREPSGYSTAVESMNRLAAAQPSRRAEADEKRCEVLRSWFARAGPSERQEVGRSLIDALMNAKRDTRASGNRGCALNAKRDTRASGNRGCAHLCDDESRSGRSRLRVHEWA
jgi:hypothetical protein